LLFRRVKYKKLVPSSILIAQSGLFQGGEMAFWYWTFGWRPVGKEKTL